jgi:hypothetical protein
VTAEGRTSSIKGAENKLKGERGKRLNPGSIVGFPEELLESRYAVNRDEILWRQYSGCLSRGRGRVNEANRILRLIRDSPD